VNPYSEIPAVTTVPDAYRTAMSFLQSWANPDDDFLWFRGVNDCAHAPVPGAYWRKDYRELDPLIDFVQDGVAFTDVGNLESWHTYYLAQHHGVPTRLLDWTSSFGAALFFALDKWSGSTTPCVWVMKPHKLNLAFFGWEGLITPENNEAPNMWLPRAIEAGRNTKVGDEPGFVFDNEWPIAVHPRRPRGRVVAQHGFFTVHGRDKRSLPELVALKGTDPQKVFARLDLSGLDPKLARHQLALLGIRRSNIYPDIDNFVLELKEIYEWE
jgi:hypothetical protein